MSVIVCVASSVGDDAKLARNLRQRVQSLNHSSHTKEFKIEGDIQNFHILKYLVPYRAIHLH